MTAILALLLAAGAGCAAAPAGNASGAGPGPGTVGGAVQADAGAGEPAAATDGLGAALRDYVRLLATGVKAGDLLGFLRAHPDWPDRGTLRIRYDAALVADGDDGEVASLCGGLTPGSARGLARCAAAAAAGDMAAGTGWARAAWRDGVDAGTGEAGAEAGFVTRWGDALTADDDWARFGRIGPPRGGASAAAALVAGRLQGVRRAVATARLALAGTAPDPGALFGAVPAAGQDDPGLVLMTARALRRRGDLDGALAFWRARAVRVEGAQAAGQAGPAGLVGQALFWAERDGLARALLAAGRGEDAFWVADDAGNALPTARGDALFLAGWIALEALRAPGRAVPLFEALSRNSPSVTTQARAAYWLARAQAAAGETAAALREDAVAASYPTTFYGQLALSLLGPAGEDRAGFRARLRAALVAQTPPRWTTAQAVAFASGTMARAAVTLVAWGEARHAKPFLGVADAQARNPVEHALAAALALSLGLPDEAVAIARRAGREGRAPSPASGWPTPVAPPPVLPAPLLLGLIRQESGFDPAAVSPSGALGLMQLMPATAAEVARRSRVAFSVPLLAADPGLNMALGAAYLLQLLGRFGGNVPASVAAYNAGPHRVSGWPAAPAAGDGAGAEVLARPDDATVDWIESIPVSETRNYVQRVLENQAVYAALAAGGRA